MIAFHDLNLPARIIPLDRIDSIGGPDKGRNRRVVLKDGDDFKLHAVDVDIILERPVQLIPAAPGTNLCIIGSYTPLDAAPDSIMRTPLIAWALCVDGNIRIVTPGGVNDAGPEPDDGFPIEMPDGQICYTGSMGPQYRDLEHMLSTRRESAAADAARGATEISR